MNTAMKSKKLWWRVDPKGYSILKGERERDSDGEEPEHDEPFIVCHKASDWSHNWAHYHAVGKSDETTDEDRQLFDKFMLEDNYYEDRFYDPMQCDNLFLRFARLETTEDLLAFVRQFGNLGNEVEFYTTVEGTNQLCAGFRLKKAVGHIRNFRRCYESWLALKRGSDERLSLDSRHFLHLYDVPAPVMRTMKFEPPRKMSEQEMLDLGLSGKGDVYWINGPPSDWFKRKLSKPDAMRAYNWAHLGAEVTAHLYRETALNLMINEDNDGLAMSFSPETLLGAIWLQFALMLTNNERWKLCGYCGEPFTFKSSKREYCSESHKSLACRKRKQQSGAST